MWGGEIEHMGKKRQVKRNEVEAERGKMLKFNI